MGIHHNLTAIHWNYFLALEDDLHRLARYVEFSDDNLKAYSLEMARLYLSACSEIDVVLKQLTEKVSPGAKAENIGHYRAAISPALPQLASFKVTIQRFGSNFEPWMNWKDDKSPDWWSDHNDVKHHRHEAFHKANLSNTLKSLAALFVTLLFLYDDKAKSGHLIPAPSLFGVTDKNFNGTTIGRHGLCVQYVLNA